MRWLRRTHTSLELLVGRCRQERKNGDEYRALTRYSAGPPAVSLLKGHYRPLSGGNDMQRGPWYSPRVVIVISPTVVGQIAKSVNRLPGDFDAAAWLKENREDIAIVATEAIREVVWEALELGLADHPLVLRRRSGGRKENHR